MAIKDEHSGTARHARAQKKAWHDQDGPGKAQRAARPCRASETALADDPGMTLRDRPTHCKYHGRYLMTKKAQEISIL